MSNATHTLSHTLTRTCSSSHTHSHTHTHTHTLTHTHTHTHSHTHSHSYSLSHTHTLTLSQTDGEEVRAMAGEAESIEEDGTSFVAISASNTLVARKIPRCEDGPITTIFRKPGFWYWPRIRVSQIQEHVCNKVPCLIHWFAQSPKLLNSTYTEHTAQDTTPTQVNTSDRTTFPVQWLQLVAITSCSSRILCVHHSNSPRKNPSSPSLSPLPSPSPPLPLPSPLPSPSPSPYR